MITGLLDCQFKLPYYVLQFSDALLILVRSSELDQLCLPCCRVKTQCECTKRSTCLLASSGRSVVTLGATRVVDLDTGTGSLAQVAATCTLQLDTKTAISWLRVLRI